MLACRSLYFVFFTVFLTFMVKTTFRSIVHFFFVPSYLGTFFLSEPHHQEKNMIVRPLMRFINSSRVLSDFLDIRGCICKNCYDLQTHKRRHSYKIYHIKRFFIYSIRNSSISDGRMYPFLPIDVVDGFVFAVAAATGFAAVRSCYCCYEY